VGDLNLDGGVLGSCSIIGMRFNNPVGSLTIVAPNPKSAVEGGDGGSRTVASRSDIGKGHVGLCKQLDDSRLLRFSKMVSLSGHTFLLKQTNFQQFFARQYENLRKTNEFFSVRAKGLFQGLSIQNLS